MFHPLLYLQFVPADFPNDIFQKYASGEERRHMPFRLYSPEPLPILAPHKKERGGQRGSYRRYSREEKESIIHRVTIQPLRCWRELLSKKSQRKPPFPNETSSDGSTSSSMASPSSPGRRRPQQKTADLKTRQIESGCRPKNQLVSLKVCPIPADLIFTYSF